MKLVQQAQTIDNTGTFWFILGTSSEKNIWKTSCFPLSWDTFHFFLLFEKVLKSQSLNSKISFAEYIRYELQIFRR